MHAVSDITHDIIAREGGFVNDPDDPGGPTKHGVTLPTLRALGLDVTDDGQVNEADVRALTVADAAEIFERNFYFKPRLNQLPEGLQAIVYDMQVHAGCRAIRILQELLAELGEPLEVDGVLGSLTLSAVDRAVRSLGVERVRDAYGIERRRYYYRLGDARPASRKFVRRRDGGKGGWILRADEFVTPLWHLTERAHRERVAAWG